jgi:cytochrome c peroxidase
MIMRLSFFGTAALLAAVAVAVACGSTSDETSEIPVDSTTGLRAAEMGPVPALPEWPDNPPSEAKRALGKSLYNDIRMSGSGTASCNTCHLATTDFQDATPRDAPDRSYPHLGPTLPRNAPSLLNVVYAKMMRWDGSYFTDVFDMAVLPYAEANMNLSHRLPPEEVEAVDVPGAQEAMQQKLTVEAPGYRPLFQQAFGEDIAQLAPKDTWRLAGKAIATYLRTVVSRDAPFDRWNAGDSSAISAAAVRGFTLFRGKAMCTACHSGPFFSDFQFHNVSTSLPDATGARQDEGRFKVTGLEKDRGAFLTPMLRSVGSTSPYLHDGSETRIVNVLKIKLGKRAAQDPNHEPLLDGIPDLSDGEVDDLVQFLKSLEGAPLAPDVVSLPTSFP